MKQRIANKFFVLLGFLGSALLALSFFSSCTVNVKHSTTVEKKEIQGSSKPTKTTGVPQKTHIPKKQKTKNCELVRKIQKVNNHRESTHVLDRIGNKLENIERNTGETNRLLKILICKIDKMRD